MMRFRNIEKQINKSLIDNGINVSCELSRGLTSSRFVIFPKKKIVRVKQNWAVEHVDDLITLLIYHCDKVIKRNERAIYCNSIKNIGEVECTKQILLMS